MKTSQHASVDVFTAIAHPVRRQILDMLIANDAKVTTLAARFDISRPAISQHLAILRDVGLVTLTEQGRENYYHLEAEQLQRIAAWVAQYERFWLGRLNALDNYLKRKHDGEEAE
jgi:DNA-binding transcriptional ArsR family regulator